MTEAVVIDAIKKELKGQRRTAPVAMQLVEEGLDAFPNSARLWILRDDLIQLSDADSPYSLADALATICI